MDFRCSILAVDYLHSPLPPLSSTPPHPPTLIRSLLSPRERWHLYYLLCFFLLGSSVCVLINCWSSFTYYFKVWAWALPCGYVTSVTLITVTKLFMANCWVPCLCLQGHTSLSFLKDTFGFQLTCWVDEHPRPSLERQQLFFFSSSHSLTHCLVGGGIFFQDPKWTLMVLLKEEKECWKEM